MCFRKVLQLTLKVIWVRGRGKVVTGRGMVRKPLAGSGQRMFDLIKV
jgi:hypothetical protein